MQRILLRLLQERGEHQEDRGPAPRQLVGGPEAIHPGHEYEPELEHVREEQEHPPRTYHLERHHARDPVREQPYGYRSHGAAPAERYPQERRHVGEIEPFIERLIVAYAAEVDEVHQEQIREVDRDRGQRSGKRPAQHEQSARQAHRRDDDLFRCHAGSIPPTLHVWLSRRVGSAFGDGLPTTLRRGSLAPR